MLYESNKRFLGPYNPVSPCQNILRVIAVTAGTAAAQLGGSEGGQCPAPAACQLPRQPGPFPTMEPPQPCPPGSAPPAESCEFLLVMLLSSAGCGDLVAPRFG